MYVGKRPKVQPVVVRHTLTSFLKIRRPEPGRYLLFGDMLTFAGDLEEAGWQGVVVTPDYPAPDSIPDSRTHIAAHVGSDPHIAQLLSGYYVKMLTVAEIFNQFPGPYALIGMCDTNRDRELWLTDNVFNALPDIYVIKEDGHNEDIMEIGKDRGYASYLVGGGQYLVLVHA